MNVAVIPARGGSKRIPRKNAREFAGVPMIVHPIERALSSGLFDRVIVSTDDAEIAEIARNHGAEVPFQRPAELADDLVGLTDVIAHCTSYLVEGGAELTAVCCILATTPFLRVEDLRSGLALLDTGEWDYVLAVSSYPAPIFRSFTLNSAGGLEMVFPEHLHSRSQDLPEALHDAGQFCWGRPPAWLEKRVVFGGNTTVVRIPQWLVQDIDTDEDWLRAELTWRVMESAAVARFR